MGLIILSGQSILQHMKRRHTFLEFFRFFPLKIPSSLLGFFYEWSLSFHDYFKPFIFKGTEKKQNTNKNVLFNSLKREN